MIKEVMDILAEIKTIHEKKNADYASIGNPFENFERSAAISGWFSNEHDKAFVVLIGTKLARLSTLLNSTTEPNNESIDDSFVDLATYCILWGSHHRRYKRGPQESNWAAANRPREFKCPDCNSLMYSMLKGPIRLECSVCNKIFDGEPNLAKPSNKS